ncbi:MAG: helix-turn-helix transcriptional regulator [Clostridia bacterium]|nr:helix-turn-helix transcriptional regulator [Clostridia bacterium]
MKSLTPETDYIIADIINVVDKQASADWYHTREDRPYHGFIFLQNGRIRCRDGKNDVAVEVDEILYLEKGSAYTLTSDSAVRPEYIIVNFQIAPAQSEDMPPLETMLERRIVPRDKLSVAEKFRRLNDIYFYMPAGYRIELRSLLYSLLYSALNASMINNVTGDEQRLLPALQQMRETFDREYDINALAGLCGLSPSHFRKLFRDYYGMSPRDYLLSLRINRAKSLLLQSDLPVGTIAEKTGFNDNAYFCKLFRMLTGTTPGTFRSSGNDMD